MEQSSCFMSDPALVTSSKRVVMFAEQIANECNLLTSDLILAAVWHCINQTKQTSTANNTTKTRDEEIYNQTVVTEDHENKQQTVTQNRAGESGPPSGVEEATVNTKTKHDTSTAENIQNRNETLTTTSKAERGSTSPDGDMTVHASKPDKNTCPEIHNGDSKSFDGKSNDNQKSNSDSKSNTDIQEISLTSQKEKLVKDVNLSEDGSVNEKQKQNNDINKKIDDEKGANSIEEHIDSDVEIISIDDEDSKDSNDKDVGEGETKVAEERVEEKEPDYFDMDCDEIDDDAEYEEMLNTSTSVAISGRSQQKETVEQIFENSEDMTDEEITIISDDEGDNGEKAAVKGKTYKAALDSPKEASKKKAEGKESSETGAIKGANQNFPIVTHSVITSPSESKTSDNEQRKIDNNEVKDKASEEYTCPVMEDMEELALGKSGSSVGDDLMPSLKRKLESDGSPDSSTAAVLRLVPVSSSQKVAEIAVSTAETVLTGLEEARTVDTVATPLSESVYMSSGAMYIKLPNFQPTQHLQDVPLHPVSSALELQHVNTDHNSLQEPKTEFVAPAGSGELVYISSELMHGCIPSLPPVQELQSVEMPLQPFDIPASLYSDDQHTAYPTPLPRSPHFRPGFQSGIYSQAYGTPKSFDPGAGSPPRKKRLLDYDKKWHTEPKYSPEQDKYLALPGGVDGNSVNRDQNVLGNYASISQYFIPPEPNVGIETVDSDFMNHQILHARSYADKDNAYESKNSSDESDSTEDIIINRKHDKRKERGRGRGRRRGVRGMRGSRGVSRIVSRGTSQRGRGTGRGMSRGFKHNDTSRGSSRGARGQRRGRRPLRGSVVTRRGSRARGTVVKFPKRETNQDDQNKSTLKLSPVNKAIIGQGSGSRGRKIGFYSVKLGNKRKSSDSPVKKDVQEVEKRRRGRPRKHTPPKEPVKRNTSIERNESGASTSAGHSGQRGKFVSSRGGQKNNRGRGRPPKNPPIESPKEVIEQEDVIVID